MKWITGLLLAVAALLGGLLVMRSQATPPLGGTALETPVTLPTLRLINDTGQPATLADSGGKLRLVFFGFVRCPDVCPATLGTLANSYKALSPEQQQALRVQLISVDPAFDRPAVMREYLDKFRPEFVGLTGDVPAIDAAAKALYVAFVPALPSSHEGHTGSAKTDEAQSTESAGVSAPQAATLHGDQVSVVDPQGRFVRVYSNGEVVDGTLARDLPGLLKTYMKSN